MVRMTDEKPSLADPKTQMLADAIWLRAEFFQTVPVLTSLEVATLAGIADKNAHLSVELWRTEGLIFSVKRGIEDFYPSFQFTADMTPLPIIREILRILRQVPSRRDWDDAMWFFASNGWLGGRTPIDLLTSEPSLVIKAAEQEVIEDIE
jgi:hypothetical protein